MRIRFDYTIEPVESFFHTASKCTLKATLLDRDGRDRMTFTYEAEGIFPEQAIKHCLEDFAENKMYNREVKSPSSNDHNMPSFRELISGKPTYIVDHLPKPMMWMILQILDAKTSNQNKVV